MRFLSSIVVVGLLSLWVSGCMKQEALPQEGIFVVWKTPGMKYADQGFLYHDGKELRLEIYASGQAVLKLEVTPSQVCTGGFCMSQKAFNARYLSPHYPEAIVEKILKGEALFDGRNLVENGEGFTQEIKKEGLYDIHYSVLNGSIVFRDTINHILIKIRKLG